MPNSAKISVIAHIVTYNSCASSLKKCLDSLAQQTIHAFTELQVWITDNASNSQSLNEFFAKLDPKYKFKRNSVNLGFCGAHNQAAKDFIATKSQYFCLLNSDLVLRPDTLEIMLAAFSKDSRIGMLTPLLLRADQNMQPLTPNLVDAAGMCLHHTLRHFDRGSGQVLSDVYQKSGYVFGGTGACLVLSRTFIEDVALAIDENCYGLFEIYPELQAGWSERWPLFDEAFFAYREDADLAWRAQKLGWRCWFEPAAVGFHQRVVLPERRDSLPVLINLLGVRNRFLLQLNNYILADGVRVFIFGLLGRNLLVLIAVLLHERTSLKAFVQICKLFSRAMARRQILNQRIDSVSRDSKIKIWLKSQLLESKSCFVEH